MLETRHSNQASPLFMPSKEHTAPLTVPAALARASMLFASQPAYSEGAKTTGASMNWRGFASRVDEVAAGLVALGLSRGDRVTICAENCIDWIVAYHAAVAAGACPVLVYFDLKPVEICEQVARPGSRFLFASAPVLRRLGTSASSSVERLILIGPESGPTSGALSLNDVAAAATTDSRVDLRSIAPNPDDLAAIVYTSGTTGGPKGVMLSHRNLVSSAQGGVEALRIHQDDSALVVLPLHHAFAFIATAIMPALVGAHAIVESDLRRLRNRLEEYSPTIFFGVPALYELMYRGILSQAEAQGRLEQMKTWLKRVRLVKRVTGVNLGPLVFRSVHRALGGRIRFMVSGAAALKSQTGLDFFALGLPLVQGSGVTEGSLAIAVQRFSRWRFLFTRYYEHHVGSVGAPLPGVEVRLIDVPEKGISVAARGEGELVLRGSNVFQGYWQAPQQTEAAIVDGWLRTGDLARIAADGSIYLTGRAKFIIVLDSGEKVYPDEIEEKLSESDLVEDICVTGRPAREKTIVAAVVYPRLEAVLTRAQHLGLELDAGAVAKLVSGDIERLCKDLAAYKRVSQIELSDQPLPKTALRKVARGQLAEAYRFDYQRWLTTTPSRDERPG